MRPLWADILTNKQSQAIYGSIFEGYRCIAQLGKMSFIWQMPKTNWGKSITNLITSKLSDILYSKDGKWREISGILIPGHPSHYGQEKGSGSCIVKTSGTPKVSHIFYNMALNVVFNR